MLVVRAQLIVEFGFDLLALENGAEAEKEIGEHRCFLGGLKDLVYGNG